MSEDDNEVIQIASDRVRCSGDPAAPHVSVELVLFPRKIVICPVCGRRFWRAALPHGTNPAVWPKDD